MSIPDATKNAITKQYQRYFDMDKRSAFEFTEEALRAVVRIGSRGRPAPWLRAVIEDAC